MIQNPKTIDNEEGSIMLLTLVILIFITIAGLGALSSTDTELKISGNDRCFRQNLTRAESAVFELTQKMRNDIAPLTNLLPSSSTLAWINTSASTFDPLTSTWDYSANAKRSDHITDNPPGCTSVYNGVAPGASLDMSSSTIMRQYEIYGRSEKCNGQVDVIAGYRIRF